MLRRAAGRLAPQIHNSLAELAPATGQRAAVALPAALFGGSTACGEQASAAATSAGAAASEAQGGRPGSVGGWHLAFAALLGLVGAAVDGRAEAAKLPPPDQEKGFNLMSLEQRRRVFIKYEKRIRELSPPEKVFEYFASQRGEAKSFSMTAGDMMRAVVPVYPPEGSDVIRAGSLPGEPSPHVHDEEASKFIQKFDIDGDSKINFDEFLLFQTLLSIPLDDLEVAFRLMDKDGSGKVDREEFGLLLDTLHVKAGKPSVSMRKSVHASQDDLYGLMAHFFGANGKKQLSLEAFKQFVCDLRAELLRLEFQHYDWQHNGFITGRDFARSIVCCARLKHIDQYLDKIQAMPADLSGVKVGFADFQQFRDMWSQLRLLSVALEFRRNTSGRIGRRDFLYTVDHVLNIKLNPQLVDVLFYLFAEEGDKLNVRYMYEVMNRHYTCGLQISYNFDKPAGAKSMFDCLRECQSKPSV